MQKEIEPLYAECSVYGGTDFIDHSIVKRSTIGKWSLGYTPS